ncbi:A/G-specific adenine glycosylase [Acidipila rosea]|uniref:Adenine DNA glycosylase n=1 Tax=Acidipila rosea TaxID=768535 RepID=A0A4R1L3M1_9BACT|nr:A/G-specific adenine glycosylase [Acidipila rosea]TCK72646.1 A/G-specific DNA-adenine glycosylase [Acidipila rosea]
MSTGKLSAQQVRDLREALMVWYDRNRRDLPWRRTGDPYAIWVSEIMLQQTRVAAVLEHYRSFMARFPTLDTLAATSEDEVLAHWSGLGYYRRARLLRKAAQFVVAECGGKLPGTAEKLRSLPGIGDYTAAAIASIGFGEPVAVVDGNVLRVMTRLQGLEGGPKAAASQVPALAQRLLDRKRPGDFNQAMMELGALICLPSQPQCTHCPVHEFCHTRGEHEVAPAKQMLSRRITYAVVKRKGRLRHGLRRTELLLERRPEDASLMAGMWELPQIPEHPEGAGGKLPLLSLRHAITNTNYYANFFETQATELTGEGGSGTERRWVTQNELPDMPLTGLARKALKRLKLWPGYSGRSVPVLLPGEGLDQIVI